MGRCKCRPALARTEKKVSSLARFISEGDDIDFASIRSSLKELEIEKKAQQRAVEDLEAQGSTAAALPSIEDIVAPALLFEGILTEDPVAGCEELRRLFGDGKVLCQPQPDGVNVAEGKLLPLALSSMRLAPETPKARDSGESSGLRVSKERAACSIIGCAGRI